MSSTGCVVPWTQVLIFPNGTVKPCCYWEGAPFGSLHENSFAEIWNGEKMRAMRAGLGGGEALPQCNKCWQEERGGAASLRRVFNNAYRARGGSIERLVTGMETSGFEARSPKLYFLNIGNLCNLQCRTCNEHCSSRIGADRVQSAWGNRRLRPAWRDHRLSLAPAPAPGVDYAGFEHRGDGLWLDGGAVIELPVDGSVLRSLSFRAASASPWRLRIAADGGTVTELQVEPGAQAQDVALDLNGAERLQIAIEGIAVELYGLELVRTRSRAPVIKMAPAGGRPWYADASSIVEMIGASPDEATVHILGGEPLMNQEVWTFLDDLVARDLAGRVDLVLSTNGTHQRADLARLAPHFHSVYVSLSVDGYGGMFEYLRHGARWGELLRTLAWLRGLPKVEVAVSATMQNYNVLDCVRLFRFCDAENLAFQCHNVLMDPARLTMTNLPPDVRRVAAARLRNYLELDCRPAQREMVHSLIDILESAGDAFDPVLFGEFMLFTNDLDAMRNQRLADEAPDLTALIAASGIAWSDDLHHADRPLPPAKRAKSFERRLPVISRAISPKDVIFAGFEAASVDTYYISALQQLDLIDVLMRRHGHAGLRACGAMADYASHYGRITRALRAAAPGAIVYACDIDPDAIDFCAAELDAVPVLTSWRPDEDAGPENLDLVICSSLLTHTGIDHWRRALRGWMQMVRPGGFVFFTYLSDTYLADWQAGRMEHYGQYSPEQRAELERQLRETGLGFAALEGMYSEDGRYGVALAMPSAVRKEAEAAGFEVLELAAAASTTFGQELAVLRRPPTGRRAPAADARLIAFYDTRIDPWTELCAAEPRPPLPTDLGFCDPRVAEVREAQARMARDHGVDGFCFSWSGSPNAPADPVLQGLLSSGRPDFPYCLTWENGEDGPKRTGAATAALFFSLLPHFRDPRYIRIDDKPVMMVADPAMLEEPRKTARMWRALALQTGLPGLHLCAREPLTADTPADLGFDSFFERHGAARSYAALAAGALSRPRPGYSLYRTVECRRRSWTGEDIDAYELWLRTVLDEARDGSPGGLVFVRAWNDWFADAYLEPDDRDGLRALSATKNAVAGPSGGAVLLHRLRGVLNAPSAQDAALIEELEARLAVREQSFARLGALVEASLSAPSADQPRRYLPVQAKHLAPAPGPCSFDVIGSAEGEACRAPIVEARGGAFRVGGWAYFGQPNEAEADRFILLKALAGSEERFYPLWERRPRPDVVAALQAEYPDIPVGCGFDETLALADLPYGDYRLGLAQRSQAGLYCGFAPTIVRVV